MYRRKQKADIMIELDRTQSYIQKQNSFYHNFGKQWVINLIYLYSGKTKKVK